MRKKKQVRKQENRGELRKKGIITTETKTKGIKERRRKTEETIIRLLWYIMH